MPDHAVDELRRHLGRLLAERRLSRPSGRARDRSSMDDLDAELEATRRALVMAVVIERAVERGLAFGE